MLRITLLSGEEVTSLALAELSDVKALKQRLHQQHGLPPRFRQRLLHEGNTLDDAVKLLGFGVPYFSTFFLIGTIMKYKFILFSPWLLRSPGWKPRWICSS